MINLMLENNDIKSFMKFAFPIIYFNNNKYMINFRADALEHFEELYESCISSLQFHRNSLIFMFLYLPR